MSSTLQITINAVFALRNAYPSGATPAQVYTEALAEGESVTLDEIEDSLALGAKKGLFLLSGQIDDGFVYLFNRNAPYVNPANIAYGLPIIVNSYNPTTPVSLGRYPNNNKGIVSGLSTNVCCFSSEPFPTTAYPGRCCE